MKSLLTILLGFILAFLMCTQPAYSETFDQAILGSTFDSMPPFEQDGSVPYLDEATAKDIGYQPGREWYAGALPSEVIELGDIEEGLGAEQFTIRQIAEIAEVPVEELTLKNLPFLENLSLEEFLGDVPFLGNWEISDLTDLLPDTKIGSTLRRNFEALIGNSKTISEAIELNPELADMNVMSVFGDWSVAEIPNLELAQLIDFEGIGNQPIINVPGLGGLPLSSFPKSIGDIINVFAKQDVAFGKEEYSGEKPTPNPVSGGTNGGKNWEPIACKGGCAHIELHQDGWEGANWMTKDHRVPDGYGMLGGVFGEAGAYRLPFGESFALQVTDTNEAAGSADWGIAFRFCAKALFVDLGCTAYFMEVPLGITTKEGDMVLTGLRDGKGGSSAPVSAPPGWKELRPNLPPELQKYANPAPSPLGGGGALCGNGPGGVKMEALAEAFHAKESRGTGGYAAIGDPISLSRGETGFALGKYQFTSYGDARAYISKAPGGAAFLAKVDRLQEPTPDEVLAVFPPDVQDRLFVENQTEHIEILLAKGYSGGRLLEILGQMHFGGPNIVTNGSLDAGELYAYGVEFRGYYEEFEKKYEDSEDRCKIAGDFINPSYDGIKGKSRGFNPTYGWNPVAQTSDKHDGDDLLTPHGSVIVASNTGVITWHTMSGYGRIAIINHGPDKNGNVIETYYAHMSSAQVASNQTVMIGYPIGLSGGIRGSDGAGNSGGPHLHFEVRINGVPVDPQTVVNYNKTAADVVRELKAKQSRGETITP